MKIFISYANEDFLVAERLTLSLRERGHIVFLDKDDLPKGKTYNDQIRRAIFSSGLFIFLISPSSVAKGRYTLSELSIVRSKWKNPSGRVLPVIIEDTDIDTIPAYLRLVTFLKPEGDVVADVAHAVYLLSRKHSFRRAALHTTALVFLLGAIFGSVYSAIHLTDRGLSELVDISRFTQDATKRIEGGVEETKQIAKRTQETAKGIESEVKGARGTMTLEAAWNALRRAQESMTRSNQGQIEGIRVILDSGANFRDYKLLGVFLDGADITGADFSGATFWGGSLKSASAQKTVFKSAQLNFADFENTNFEGSNFEEARGHFVNASGANFKDASFVRANLSASSFRHANLEGADLSNANFAYADFTGANLKGAKLNNALMVGAIFERANLDGAIFDNTDITSAPGIKAKSKLYPGDVCARIIIPDYSYLIRMVEEVPSPRFESGVKNKSWFDFDRLFISSTYYSHLRNELCQPLPDDQLPVATNLRENYFHQSHLVAFWFPKRLVDAANRRAEWSDRVRSYLKFVSDAIKNGEYIETQSSVMHSIIKDIDTNIREMEAPVVDCLDEDTVLFHGHDILVGEDTKKLHYATWARVIHERSRQDSSQFNNEILQPFSLIASHPQFGNYRGPEVYAAFSKWQKKRAEITNGKFSLCFGGVKAPSFLNHLRRKKVWWDQQWDSELSDHLPKKILDKLGTTVFPIKLDRDASLFKSVVLILDKPIEESVKNFNGTEADLIEKEEVIVMNLELKKIRTLRFDQEIHVLIEAKLGQTSVID